MTAHYLLLTKTLTGCSMKAFYLFLFFLVWCSGSIHSLPVQTQIGDDATSRAGDLCQICLDAVDLFMAAVDSNLTLDTIYPLIHSLCLQAQPSGGEYMCPGFIYSYGPVIIYVLSDIFIEPKVICQDFNFCNKSHSEEILQKHLNTGVNRALERLKEKFNITKMQDISENTLNTLREELKSARHELLHSEFFTSNSGSLKAQGYAKQKAAKQRLKSKMKEAPKDGVIRFLQLSDIHLDHQYDEGSPSDCGLYLCCRWWYNGTGKAGHYGSYGCDLPMPTLDLLADALQKLNPQPDFVIYTGDNAPHDVWNETWTTQLSATQFIVKYLSEKLPNLTIYPAIGNHESWPESEYLGTLIEYQTLNKYLSDFWQSWVDFPQESLDTIAEGGYYNIKVMDKLRIVSFNSNYGYSLNFYSYLNDMNDHYKNQLLWMEKQLQQAAEQGDKVLLIAHIPPGDTDNHAEYGEFYLNLTKRYSTTIVGHLFGHTHTDQFQLVQDAEGVYGVALIAPSVTTFGHINPSFRMFTMDAASEQLLGYDQYYLNVTLANELHELGSGITPQFELSYSTQEEYGLKDLSPDEWSSLFVRLASDPSVLNKYSFNIRSKSTRSDKNCDSSCKKHILCSVTNVVSSQYLQCMGG